MEHQDWNITTISKTKVTVPQQKQITHQTTKFNEIDRSTEAIKINKISETDRLTIINLRNKNKLSQEDLAKRLNIRKELIRDIENGIYIENKVFIKKIINVLSSLCNSKN